VRCEYFLGFSYVLAFLLYALNPVSRPYPTRPLPQISSCVPLLVPIVWDHKSLSKLLLLLFLQYVNELLRSSLTHRVFLRWLTLVEKAPARAM
jgi:hypothetical protein